MNRAEPRPIRLHEVNSQLDCNVQRIIGYMATCSCGWKGGYRTSWSLARADSHEHNREHRSTA